MTDRRVRPAALAVLSGLLIALVGCGVPGSGPPVVVGNAPKLEAPQGIADARPPSPNDARDGAELVLKYLQAAAWANGTSAEDRPQASEDATRRVREFLVDDIKQKWQPLTDLTVVDAKLVQQKPVGDGRTQVTMDLRPIGTLAELGWVEPTAQPPGAPPIRWTFEVVQSGSGWRIAKPPPPGMLISAEALSQLYEAHPIYFWDNPDRELVPDLRYLPRSVPDAKRPTVLVNWLLGGPSPWLYQAVQRVPEGIVVSGNVIPAGQPDSPLVVNLSNKAASLQDRLPHLVSQLRWSLRPYTGPVQLQIERQRQTGVDGSSSAYLEHNPAVPPAGVTDPDGYCVVAGRVVPSEWHTGRPKLPRLVASPFNKDVVSAAVNRTRNTALVKLEGTRQRLYMGTSETGNEHYTQTAVLAHLITAPVWVSWPSSGVLVSADGELFYVPGNGENAVDVTPDGFAGKITALAVAPDNRRLALIAGSQVYVTTLLTTGTLTVAPPRPLVIDLTDPVGVAWSQETRVVVAGRLGAESTLAEISVDGVTIKHLQLSNLANLSVSRLAGYPPSPVNGPGSIGLPGFLMVEAGGRAWRVFHDQVGELYPEDRTANAVCSAPFFVD